MCASSTAGPYLTVFGISFSPAHVQGGYLIDSDHVTCFRPSPVPPATLCNGSQTERIEASKQTALIHLERETKTRNGRLSLTNETTVPIADAAAFHCNYYYSAILLCVLYYNRSLAR